MTLRQRPLSGGVTRARVLRAAMTEAERKLWSMLRGRRFQGIKFRRQAPIGRYIADFLAPEVKLVIEADGGQHTPETDAERTVFLESQGYRVLRLTNAEILTEPDFAWRKIMAAVGAASPQPRGKLTPDAPLAPLVWFKSGGAAAWLFEPADTDDLAAFLKQLPPEAPVMALGLGSNLIVRDGGVPGVVIRLGKAFATVTHADATTLTAGGGASGILVSSTARDAGIAGLEFLRGIPGTVGGFVRMNGGAYGREVADVLVDATVVLRSGAIVTLAPADLHYSYRHSDLPDGATVVRATLRGAPGDPAAIQAEMDRIAAAREASQPLRTRTGGSTFKNPPGHKAWELVDRAGCRGLTLGGAQVSEKHTNFLINTGTATSADIEALGEEVRRRVRETVGVELEWEIARVGTP